MRFLSLVCLFALAIISCFAELKEIGLDDHKTLKLADFALSELSKLSDSGIYKTLKLNSILYAAEEDGLFHYNTVLDLKLSSPYFKSGEEEEVFRMIVMEHKTDKTFTLAISEFPEMDEAAIEKYWIAKVEQKRVEREEAFRRLEIEALMLKNEEYKLKYEREDMETILHDLDSKFATSRYVDRVNEAAVVFEATDKSELRVIDRELAALSLVELYFITLGGEWNRQNEFEHHYAVDYIRYRAQMILDKEMNVILNLL